MTSYAENLWPDAQIILPVDVEHFDEDGNTTAESRGDWETYMSLDFAQLIRCDACLFDNYWWNSKGCRLEHAICRELGIDIFLMTL